MTGDDMYVRSKVISDRKKDNPYFPGGVEQAWVQPYVSSKFKVES